MPDEITGRGFRDKLLDAQQTTPALREEYRKELDALINHRLTAGTRAATWGGLIVAGVFAVLLVRALVLQHETPGVKLIMPAYVFVALGTMAWFGRVIWQGET